MIISVTFQLHPLMASEEMIFLYFFASLTFFGCHGHQSREPIKFSGSKKNHMLGRGLLKIHFCKTFIKYICSETAINANFHFHYYKSMATITCHSNHSSYPIGKSHFVRFPGL